MKIEIYESGELFEYMTQEQLDRLEEEINNTPIIKVDDNSPIVISGFTTNNTN